MKQAYFDIRITGLIDVSDDDTISKLSNRITQTINNTGLAINGITCSVSEVRQEQNVGWREA